MVVTRFPSRAKGLADRMSGFVAHPRMNGIKLGLQETGDALSALASVAATDSAQARHALCALLVPDAEGSEMSMISLIPTGTIRANGVWRVYKTNILRCKGRNWRQDRATGKSANRRHGKEAFE